MGSRRDLFFPDPESADPYGLVAVTRAMTPELLMEAYQRGIFPWSERPVRWYSPDPRAIFLPERVHLPRSLKRTLNQNIFTASFERDFRGVFEGCARAHEREGVWISDGFIAAYSELHRMGYAHSVEVWQEDRLVDSGGFGRSPAVLVQENGTDVGAVEFAQPLRGALGLDGRVLVREHGLHAYALGDLALQLHPPPRLDGHVSVAPGRESPRDRPAAPQPVFGEEGIGGRPLGLHAAHRPATGPVASPEDLGGGLTHTSISGVCDYLASDENEGLLITRRVGGQTV